MNKKGLVTSSAHKNEHQRNRQPILGEIFDKSSIIASTVKVEETKFPLMNEEETI